MPALPPAPRKTLLEWIDQDDEDTANFDAPKCSAQDQALHARLIAPVDGAAPEPIAPPSGLLLAPLG